jgi:hypothetical protein
MVVMVMVVGHKQAVAVVLVQLVATRNCFSCRTGGAGVQQASTGTGSML